MDVVMQSSVLVCRLQKAYLKIGIVREQFKKHHIFILFGITYHDVLLKATYLRPNDQKQT